MQIYIPDHTIDQSNLSNNKSSDSGNIGTPLNLQQYFINGANLQLNQNFVGSPHLKFNHKVDFYEFLYPIVLYLPRMLELNR